MNKVCKSENEGINIKTFKGPKVFKYFMPIMRHIIFDINEMPAIIELNVSILRFESKSM